MGRLRTLISIGIFACMLSSGSAFADTILPWTDTKTVWPDWGGTSGEDSLDTIGQPQITGGAVVINDAGFIKSVSYNFNNPPGWTFSRMEPGDLFLDTNADGTWDYVLSRYNTRSNSDNTNKYIPSTPPTLYGWTSSSSYLVTGSDNSGYWSGYNIRNNHPFAATGLLDSLGVGSLTGGYSNSSPVTYTLPENVVKFTGVLTFGFTENCANDVVLESVIPEPSSLLLMGTGILGLGLLGRRKLGKQN